jgi:hypothetical protein
VRQPASQSPEEMEKRLGAVLPCSDRPWSSRAFCNTGGHGQGQSAKTQQHARDYLSEPAWLVSRLSADTSMTTQQLDAAVIKARLEQERLERTAATPAI